LQEEEDRDKNILKKASEHLLKQTEKSKNMMKQQQEYVIEAQKKMQEMIKGMMVQSTVEYEKILDPRDCYSPELLGGNPDYIKGICSKMPDPTGPVDIKVHLHLSKRANYLKDDNYFVCVLFSFCLIFFNASFDKITIYENL
jgi:hypothetical protein